MEIEDLKSKKNGENDVLITCLESERNVQSVISKHEDLMVMFLGSGHVFCADIKRKDKRQLAISKKIMGPYCTQNISYGQVQELGFDSSDINIDGNNIIFGVERTEINALNIPKNANLSYKGDIKWRDYVPIYQKHLD